MFAASRLVPQVQKIAQQSRNMSVISGPPTVKVSAGEKLIHGIAMTVGMLIIPAWVLTHIKHYRGQE